MRRLLATAMVALAAMLAAAPAWAQFETASVVGTVRDSSGAVVPDAKVTLTNTPTGVSVTRVTARRRQLRVRHRPAGHLRRHGGEGRLLDRAGGQRAGAGRRAAARGLARWRSASCHENASRSRPRRRSIETDTSQRSQVITGEQMRELPLNGREYSALALLSTGVRQSALNKSTNGTPREGAFNVNGLRSMFNNFLIDGVDNNAYGTSNQGFSNQVMQPAPDAVGEFRVVTNNQSAEYGRAAGATINVAYRSGTNQFHGDALGVLPRHRAERHHLSSSRRRREAAAAAQSVRRRARRPDRQEQGVLLRRLRGLPPEPQADRVLDARRRPRRTPGILPRRHSRPAHRRDVYPAGTPIPMTAFARKVLGGLPAPNLRRRREQLLDPPGVHQRHGQGGRQGRPPDQPGAVAVRPLRLARSQHRRSADDSAAIGRRRQRQHLRAQQAARRSARPTRRAGSLAARSPVRLVEHPGRQEPAGARRSASTRSASPGCRPTHGSPAGCRRSRSPATRRSDARRPTRSGSTRRSGTRRSTTRG